MTLKEVIVPKVVSQSVVYCGDDRHLIVLYDNGKLFKSEMDYQGKFSTWEEIVEPLAAKKKAEAIAFLRKWLDENMATVEASIKKLGGDTRKVDVSDLLKHLNLSHMIEYAGPVGKGVASRLNITYAAPYLQWDATRWPEEEPQL